MSGFDLSKYKDENVTIDVLLQVEMRQFFCGCDDFLKQVLHNSLVHDCAWQKFLMMVVVLMFVAESKVVQQK